MSARNDQSQALKVFLCHSSGDKPAVRDLYQRLRADGIEPWLDEEELLPGQAWDREIRKAIRAAHVVLVCLSESSVSKTGYVQKEIKHALDIADEQPEDTIYIIPVKLEECDVPERLSRWHWVNLFEERGYTRLMQALRVRSEALAKVLERTQHSLVSMPPTNSQSKIQSSSSRLPSHRSTTQRKFQFPSTPVPSNKSTRSTSNLSSWALTNWKNLNKSRVLCSNDHANDPANIYCDQCGEAIPP